MFWGHIQCHSGVTLGYALKGTQTFYNSKYMLKQISRHTPVVLRWRSGIIRSSSGSLIGDCEMWQSRAKKIAERAHLWQQMLRSAVFTPSRAALSYFLSWYRVPEHSSRIVLEKNWSWHLILFQKKVSNFINNSSKK